MLSGLILTAFLMGLGGMPHCAAMCGAPCAVAFPHGLPWLSLVGRCLGYTALGAVAAVSAGAVASWGREIAFVKPLWMMLLAAAVMLGFHLARSGQMPGPLNDSAMDLYRKVRARWVRAPVHPSLKPAAPLIAGLVWVVMPCGLLYAALMVAVLAPHAWGGALVMLAFAIPGAFGVWAAPALLRGMAGLGRAEAPMPGAIAQAQAAVTQQGAPITWIARAEDERPMQGADGRQAPAVAQRPGSFPPGQFDPRWAVRISGLLLAGMAGWALYHQLWAQWQIWCA